MEDVGKIELRPDSIIYIYCEANLMTGGPEALHQLRYYLELSGFNAYMVYTNKKKGIGATPERYYQYFPSGIKEVNEDEIIDSHNNCIITSESSTCRLRRTKYTQKVIWWLSVVNRDTNWMDSVFSVKTRLARIVKICSFWNTDRRPYPRKKAMNLCASKFAYSFVTDKLKLPAAYLIEPISKEFLDMGRGKINGIVRKNVVAYNPSKPSKVMKLLLARNNFDFLPIKGMTPCEIAEAFRKIKLYIDFGNFPGPERMPKEAVYNGCNILVGKHNAAVNDFDIAIPNSYKMDDAESIDNIEKKIQEMLDNYEKESIDFEHFRNQIQNLEPNFIKSIKQRFHLGDSDE